MTRGIRLTRPVLPLALALLAGTCGSSSAEPRPAAAPAVAATLVAVGDVACPPGSRTTARLCRHAAVARVAEGLNPVRLALLGDLQYPNGTLSQYRGSFGPTWGRLRGRARPVPGNHEYNTRGAAGYYAYFGGLAGPRGRGYYSYGLGGWHIVALNSNCGAVSCATGAAQLRWLRADLRAHPARCTLAYWHHPRFSSGYSGNYPATGSFWSALYAAGADLVLVGHDHDYERFAPQDPAGRLDPARGIRQIVVGTGGQLLRPLRAIRPNSEVRNDSTFGVLALSLHPSGYAWRFVPEPGSTFTDAGSGTCH